MHKIKFDIGALQMLLQIGSVGALRIIAHLSVFQRSGITAFKRAKIVLLTFSALQFDGG
jgi:hypothetical protein